MDVVIVAAWFVLDDLFLILIVRDIAVL